MLTYGNYSITAFGRMLTTAVIVMVCLFMGGCSAPDGNDGIYNDGVYEGKALGYNANITVLVTVEDDKVTDVTVVSHADDESYWNNAQRVIEWIIASGTPEVDAVSSATYSSNGIIMAVEDALSKAVR